MIYRVEVRMSPSRPDPHAQGVLAQVRELGIAKVRSIGFARLFFLAGGLDAQQAQRVGQELLADPVTEQFTVVAGAAKDAPGGHVIEVHLKHGVMDPVAASTLKAIGDMGISAEAVRTARRYELEGDLEAAELALIARRLLANDCIEDAHFSAYTPPESHPGSYQLQVREIAIRDLDEAALLQLSQERDLFLNVTEMKAIQDYYRRLGREPRDVEIETFAQTWSEHCGHKTFRSDVRVRDASGKVVEQIPNLIKSTVFAATAKLAKPWCISVFSDNAGVIEFDDTWAVCFKVETHNHPSALDPYGGAGTGIGGVVRDPMGTGLGALPVANTDIFCFGPSDLPMERLPKGVLHPRRVMRGVVSGVRDYANRMGIPTVNGAVYFDEKYVGNPLVFCGTVGLLPRDKCFKRTGEGDAIVVVGGRTGRDGIHGATFSSGELTHEHETEFSGAVQIGNAITEKKVLDTLIQARDLGLYSALTDCGAGGLSSAVGEMGETIGAEVHLDRVPLKYAGLSYWEIWESEAQERMVLSVQQDKVQRVLELFASEDVEATVIGTFGTADRKLRLYYTGTLVCEIDMQMLHEGLPRPAKDALWEHVAQPSPSAADQADYGGMLKKILASPNVASKEWIIRQYDHEVQGGSVIKPLVGVTHDGPGDAAVVRPVLGSPKGVVIACGMNPTLGDLDPYQSALHAIDEALRNVVAVGGNLDRTAILDNFCWGNCNKPDRMGSFVQAAKACYDGAMTYQTPFISGKDSLNNEFQTDDGRTIAIPPTLLISAISVIDDAAKCVTADAKAAGNLLFQVGLTRPELGGSHYFLAAGIATGNDVPPVDPAASRKTMLAVQNAIAAGLVRACHDLSEGGLAVAAAEMAFSGGLGVELDLAAAPADASAGQVARLFGESAGRFLVEVPAAKKDALLAACKGVPVGQVGRATEGGRIVVTASGKKVLDVAIAQAKAAWQGAAGRKA